MKSLESIILKLFTFIWYLHALSKKVEKHILWQNFFKVVFKGQSKVTLPLETTLTTEIFNEIH